MALDPTGSREFVQRDWSRFEERDRSRRAAMSVDERMRIASALYEAARATRPGWPTDQDRREDLAHHLRMRALLDRARDVGRR